MWQHQQPGAISRVKYIAMLMVGAIPGDNKDDKGTTMTTNDPKWRRGESRKTTHITTTDDTWRPKWRPKYNPDDPGDNRWLPWTIIVMTHWRPKTFSWRHLMTPSGNIYRQSRKLPVLQRGGLKSNWPNEGYPGTPGTPTIFLIGGRHLSPSYNPYLGTLVPKGPVLAAGHSTKHNRVTGYVRTIVWIYF